MKTVAMAVPRTLGEFIQREIDRRHLSNRQFADLLGVSHTIINKFLDHGSKDVGEPSLDFLVKLGKGTGTNPLVLLALADPRIADSLRELAQADNSALLRSQRIEQLPENMREAIDTIIFERAKMPQED